MPEIIPTVVPKSLQDITNARARYATISDSLHIDIVDGIFADNATWMPSGEKLPDTAAVRYEAHLMMQNPLSVGVALARAGVRRVIGHVEAFRNAECAREVFDMWGKAGAKEVGVAILFETRLEDLMPYIALTDFVHMMTIARIGKQGLPFEARSIERVRQLHEKFPDVVISVDGGGKSSNVGDLARAGASRFCIGTALAKAKDPQKEYSRILKAATV